jgi:hypothetical protein
MDPIQSARRRRRTGFHRPSPRTRPSRPYAGAHLLPAGRWKDSIRVNLDAARQDEAYIRESNDKGYIRYGYYPHNVHFVVTSAQMGGDLPTAIREANKLATIVDAETATQLPWVQAIYAAPFFATLQFAPAAEVLAMPEPDPRLAYVQGVRHYVRAVAYAQQHNDAGFDKEMRELARTRQLQALKPMVDQACLRQNYSGWPSMWRGQICVHPRPPSPGRRPLPPGGRDRGQDCLYGAALVVLSGQPVPGRRPVSRWSL